MRDVFNMGASLVAQMIKNLPAIQETQVRSLGWEDPPEKKIANDEPVQAGAGAAASRNSEDNLPPGGHAASAAAAAASCGGATPASRGAGCLRTPSPCRPAARSTRGSTPTPQSISQFSKKCSERWKTMSAKEKSKFEDMAKRDKARYDREMKIMSLLKVTRRERKKIPTLQKGLHLPSSCFAPNIAQRSKANTLAYPLGILQKNWVECGLSSQPKINSRMNRKQLS